MSEFKPQHDVSKSGRMAFAEGPEGECVAVFDLVRWLLHSGACGDISAANQTTTDKLHVAVAGGRAVYRASTSAYWARPVGDGDVLRQENPGGWVTGRVISYPDFVAGEEVQRTVRGKGSHRPYRPALVGPSGAIEWLVELLSTCGRFDAFQSVTARKTTPHFGIRRADAVALFGYPPAPTGEAQVAQAGDPQVTAQGSGNSAQPMAAKPAVLVSIDQTPRKIEALVATFKRLKRKRDAWDDAISGGLHHQINELLKLGVSVKAACIYVADAWNRGLEADDPERVEASSIDTFWRSKAKPWAKSEQTKQGLFTGTR